MALPHELSRGNYPYYGAFRLSQAVRKGSGTVKNCQKGDSLPKKPGKKQSILNYAK
jgi:hypothetical protein